MDKQKMNYGDLKPQNLETRDSLKDSRENPRDLIENLYTRKMCKEFFRVSYVTLFNWKKRKILVPIAIGGKVYYRKSDIENLINQKFEQFNYD